MKNFAVKFNQYFYIFIFLIFFVYYYNLIFVFKVATDIQHHVRVVLNIINGVDFPPNFLYFLAVGVLGLFQDNYDNLLFASVIVISLSIAYKFYLTTRFFAKETSLSTYFSKTNAFLISNIVGTCLITVFCIYLPKNLGITEYFYLGQMPPNVWHNSTTIFLMPFALLLYYRSYQLLDDFKIRKLTEVSGLIIINILIKPSFFFCFIIVFPLLSLIRFKLKREFFLCLAPLAIGFTLLILEYLAIYHLGSYAKVGHAGLTIAPFGWWSVYSDNILVSFLLSTAFPLTYLVFYINRVKNNLFLYYAYLLLVVAVAILSLLSETGYRQTDGNFLWQAIVCNNILFFVVVIDFVKNQLQHYKFNLKDKILTFIFFLHLLSGWLYLAKTLFRSNYG